MGTQTVYFYLWIVIITEGVLNSILDRIKSPKDLKSLSKSELKTLAEEIREFLIDTVSETGGHFSSNLGIIELTIALHRVFESPRDKLIWDVGHQCYPHKVLTGRKNDFNTLRQKGGLSGFPRREESIHDIVDVGHASSSVSSAVGISVGQQLLGQEGYVISVIGDGSLTGGMAYEALNHLGHIQNNTIVVLNDNNMAIGKSVGAISSMLSRLTTTASYQTFRKTADWLMLHFPFIGERFYSAVMRWKRSVKSLFYKTNIFTDLGLKYIGPINGHNIDMLTHVLENIKRLKQPILLHVVTEKGKGYKQAEEKPGVYHGVKPFDRSVGMVSTPSSSVTYSEAFSKEVMKAAEKDKRVVAITAAMTSGTGLTPFQEKYPNRFFDVGITEEHAVTFAGGLAIAGLKPVVAIYSTFLQRAVDQVIQDVAISSLPVVFTLDRAGLVPGDGETHQGLFDITLFKGVPGVDFMAPSGEKEMALMMEYALAQDHPVIIRYAKGNCLEHKEAYDTPLTAGQGVMVTKGGGDILFISFGELLKETLGAREILKEEGIYADVYNLRFISPLDEEHLVSIASSYSKVFIVEDGIKRGGIGENISVILGSSLKEQEVLHLGAPSRFLHHATRPELIRECAMDADSLAASVRQKLVALKGDK